MDESHRQRWYATRALRLIRHLAGQHDVSPVWILIAPGNVASRRAVERIGFRLIDVVDASPEALRLGLGPPFAGTPRTSVVDLAAACAAFIVAELGAILDSEPAV